jgi:hypothetical protein
MKNKDRRALLLLTFLLLATTLPFVNRAYFVDDYYFVTMAKGIIDHPLRPYDFLSDDAGIANVGWERGHAPRMVNPPLFHYFLAGVIKVWGEDAWKLRTASLLFSLLSLWAAYYLGRRFVKHPLAAASLLAVTPAFWLTSYSLLIDSTLLAFCLWALLFFIWAQKYRRWSYYLVSGLFMGAALLTKYTGFLIFPVLLLWGWRWRDHKAWLGTGLAFGTCGVLFGLWCLWTTLTYGEPHFTATFTRGFHPAAPIGLLCFILFVLGTYLYWRFSGTRRVKMAGAVWITGALACGIVYLKLPSLTVWIQTFYIDKIIGVASFLSGCSVFLLFMPFWLWKRNRQQFALAALLLTLMGVIFHSRIGGYEALQSAMLAFFIACTGLFILEMIRHFRPSGDRNPQWLLAWTTLGLIELVVVMPWTAGRYLLIVMPPVVWLFTRYAEETRRWRLWKISWVATFVMGAALARVDFQQANVIQPLSQVLQSQKPLFEAMAPKPKHHWYYLADTFDGSQPYVLSLGWENVFPYQDFAPGSLFLRSVYRKSSWWTVKNPERFQAVALWEYPSRIPLRVMDVPASAGFYASCWGILPYAITPHPLERFELYLVK